MEPPELYIQQRVITIHHIPQLSILVQAAVLITSSSGFSHGKHCMLIMVSHFFYRC